MEICFYGKVIECSSVKMAACWPINQFFMNREPKLPFTLKLGRDQKGKVPRHFCARYLQDKFHVMVEE